MILDRTHRPWAAMTVIVMIAATAIYWAYAVLTPTGPQGGTLIGMGFGVASALMMLLAGLLAIQRRMLLFPVGTRQAWLRAHIWFGLLCVPFALFHTGFELGGAIEKWLWFLTVTVVGSGVWGLVMQQVIPRYLMLRVPEETFVEQIPHRLKVLKVECDLAVADAVGPMALPDAPRLRAFVEADRMFQDQEAPAEAKGKAKAEVKLPTSRTEEYLRNIARWPQDLRPLELALNARGKRGIMSALAHLGDELTVLVQVGLERRKLIKTDIWKKLPEFVEGLYGQPEITTPAALEESILPTSGPKASPAAKAAARSAATAADSKPAPGQPLSKAEQIRQAQMAKIQAGEAPPVDKRSKAEQLIESHKALAKATLDFEESERIKATLDVPIEDAAESPPPEKPLSKIEQIRAAQLAKSKGAAPAAEPAPAGDKPMSKVEQIRAAQLAKANAASPAAEAPPAPEKPMSKVEQIRAAQLAKANAAAAPAEPAADKPLSKVEQIRQAQLAKNQAKDEPPPAGDKPLSKLEQARLQAAARKAQNPDA